MNQGKIAALDSPYNLKQQFGRRRLVAELAAPGGGAPVKQEIDMDTRETAQAVADLFNQQKVITLHSAEATLEDIFIQITGQRLNQ